jgi:hypothetical protein
MLNAIGMHHAFVAIGLPVAARDARAIGRADVMFMLIMIGFVITGIRQVFFAGSHTKGNGQDHQAMGEKGFHVGYF